MEKVDIDDAKRIAQKHAADAVIVVAFKGGSFAVTSYGHNRQACSNIAAVADQIHEDIIDGGIPIPPLGG